MTSKNNNGCWILTIEYNDHDQHGEYFEACWANKPSFKQLAEFFKYTKPTASATNVMNAVAFLEHLLEGGGRRDTEYYWYNLKFVEFKS